MFNSTVRLSAAAALGTAIFAAAPASAAETSGNLSVTATVTSNCALSTTAVAFGDVDVTSGNNDDATGSISVTCTSGTAWSASAGAGNGDLATLIDRKMQNSTNMLSYNLYADSARTSIWGDGVGGVTVLISDTGDGSAQSKTIYGRVPSGQGSLPAGSYADTVAVTVTY